MADNTPILLSSWSTTPIEEVADVSKSTVKIFQMYLSKVDDVNIDLWKRVKEAGFKAIALTTDTQLLGKREDDVRNQFSLPLGLRMANYDKYSGYNNNIKSSGKDSGLAEYVRNHKDPNIGWEIINKIKKYSGLPVAAKGVLCAEDALIALEYGADAIFVSNHGAR